MLDIPILRQGRVYESVEHATLVHHATREPVARMSMANSGLISRDVSRLDNTVLESIPVRELLATCKRAAVLFANDTLDIAGGAIHQSFDDYIRVLSGTTGSPITYCRNNAGKVHRVLDEMETVLRGLTRGFDWEILDRGWGAHNAGTLSYYREGRTFGVILPSNSPGVHSLWIPAIPLKAPLVLKPGREEPWTPLRVIAALTAAGVPAEAFSFYPTDHGGAATILQVTSRSMLFGDSSATRPWADDPRVELHGPGLSKILLGEDVVDDWDRYVDVMAESIIANGGRSCINSSAIFTPRHGRALAEALAERFAPIRALPADDPEAKVAAFANPAVAERIDAVVEHALRDAGAEDVTLAKRGGPRLARIGEVAYLLPTIVHVTDRDHPLAIREFLFPYASVVECPQAEMLDAIGPTLIGTAITSDEAFIRELMQAPQIDRLNIGPVPTFRISWDQPHEGNLFEHLYRQRAFQIEPAA